MRSNQSPRLPSCTPGVQRWNYLCSSATDCTDQPGDLLPAIPGITLEITGEVERIGARGPEADRDDDGLETIDRSEARPHFGDQFMLRDEKKVFAKALGQTVCQLP